VFDFSSNISLKTAANGAPAVSNAQVLSHDHFMN